MPKILVVFGATGNQGGSVVDSVLEDATLSKKYQVRAVTRDASSGAAQLLRNKGVEVVEASYDDERAVAAALKNAHTVFSNTVSVFDDDEAETLQGNLIADQAVKAGAVFLVWSGLPSPAKISQGKNAQVIRFETKVAVEDYIKTLPIKSAFYWPAIFMQNLWGPYRPQPAGDGRYVLRNLWNRDTMLPLIDPRDSGKFVAPVLADPEFFAGKHIAGVSGVYTPVQFAETVGEATGKHVEYEQVTDEEFKALYPELVSMMQHFREYSYYGPTQPEEVKFALEHATSEPKTLLEFLENTPLDLGDV
ncbi:LAMI_0G01530g1_1 [Lachancea mirantina]|uniref:LAMI_0G01530g1_1 n=1 Tax=Lachancea mirantina TaxID=1230905 RepID=A0A1G4K7G5_9SACH|nr:LAMI_0G01530g1_1 [Lachancea mirantina]